MKSLGKTYFHLVLILNSFTANAQDVFNSTFNIDSLKKVLLTQREDSNRVNTLNALAYRLHQLSDYNNAMQLAKEALAIAEKINFKKGKGDAYLDLSPGKSNDINSSESLEYTYSALKAYTESGYKPGIARALGFLGEVYFNLGNDSEALENYTASLKIDEQIGDKKRIAQSYNFIGKVYAAKGKYKEALDKYYTALKLFEERDMPDWGAPMTYYLIGYAHSAQGDYFIEKGDKVNATNSYTQARMNELLALKGLLKSTQKASAGSVYTFLGNLNMKLKEFPEAKQDLINGLQLAKKIDDKSNLSDIYKTLSLVESQEGNYKEALKHHQLADDYKDSLNGAETSKKLVQAQMQHEYEEKETLSKATQEKKDAEAKRIKNQQYFAIASLAVVVLAALIIAFIQFRNNKQKQKANLLITQQKEKVESTLSELKLMQAQLIQSEKMASLGELTAGIAHEIQNPLNFVNNFSEVNKELIEELKIKNEELKIENNDVKELLEDISANEEKINYHGKRADAIVKGMLQHSRSSVGAKEPTDINALCDEYLRLSYHGIRAKDKEFNADFTTDFDSSIGNINIIPQDIGRVLLNLYNNAFYAVKEKQVAGLRSDALVAVSTKKTGNRVSITVRVNGNGIPQSNVDKIFQPFFTTKPTGQGTGLGLSLSYDIVKAHGVEIKVESKEGEGTAFIIVIPHNLD